MISTPIHIPSRHETFNIDVVKVPSLVQPGAFIDFKPFQDDMSHELSTPIPKRGKKCIMFFDVEATSNQHTGQMTEFAFVLMDVENGIIEDYFRSYIPVEQDAEWNTNTLTDFWMVNPPLFYNTYFYCGIMRESKDEVMHRLVAWIRSHSKDKNITLVSDNPAFDAYWINMYLPDEVSIYDITGSFKPIIDLRSWSFGITGIDIFESKEAFLSLSHKWLKEHKCVKPNKFNNGNVGPHEKYCHSALTDAIRGSKLFFYFYYSIQTTQITKV